MAPLSVTLQRDDPPVGIVTLFGEHDAYSAGRLESELAVLVDAGIRVVVDLSDATFVDSQTLSVLLTARHQAEQADLGFAIVLPPSEFTQVHRILDMTGLSAAFAVCPNTAAALDAARAGRTAGEHQRVA